VATLVGTFEHGLDEKGRLIVPAKLREALGETFIATLGLGRDPCVLLYPIAEWDRLVQRIDALPEFDDEAAEARRVLGAYAHECTMDAQGRTMIPAPLRTHAGLDGDVVIIGALRKAEVWARDRCGSALAQTLTPERLAEVRRKHAL